MKRLLWTLPLVAALCGCAGYRGYMLEDPDGPGPEPPRYVSATGDTLAAGLSGFEQGGIISGIIALLLTGSKTLIRTYTEYKEKVAAKAAEKAPTK